MKFFQQLGKIYETCQNAILGAFCAIYYSRTENALWIFHIIETLNNFYAYPELLKYDIQW